jgi:hypothetical protein
MFKKKIKKIDGKPKYGKFSKILIFPNENYWKIFGHES